MIVSTAFAGIDLNAITGLSYEVNGSTLTIYGVHFSSMTFVLQADDLTELTNPICHLPIAYIPENPPPIQWSPDEQALLCVASTFDEYTGAILSFDFAPTASTINFLYSSAFGAPTIVIGSHAHDLTGYSMTVPEPVTMLLLASGGLLLISRRKQMKNLSMERKRHDNRKNGLLPRSRSFRARLKADEESIEQSNSTILLFPFSLLPFALSLCPPSSVLCLLSSVRRRSFPFSYCTDCLLAALPHSFMMP
ncbi:MAG: PEP-CTERM sorting domain-containing protein [Planctomycetaceae bacterium]|nr:PEP-CTERM sorting domain-containing protein [Planctomycetaceae bacterium]